MPPPASTTASLPNAEVPPDQPSPQTDGWVLPGELGQLTTRLELEAKFGKADVREEAFRGAEGIGTYPVLVVFPDDPPKRLEIVLDADNPDAPIRELRVSDARSLWHAASGLKLGMTLTEMVALNGAPVSFYGLGWDYGGTVHDWHGGTLANAVGASVFRRVALADRAGAGAAERTPQGDTVFHSDDPRFPSMGENLVVGELGISWPSDGDE